MPILKCKMCGGDLVITPDSTVCECEYCGSKQTIPVVDDDKKLKLYERANKLRYNCDFDKAASVYENIIADFPDEAEAYWGLLLCKFGIEYVDSPDNRKVPTCHRSSFDSIMDDPDFEMVMENADSAACDVYRAQAKEIEAIRKGIIEVSGKEAPYDIFICYKETAEDGQRTLDSVLAQDIYDALTAKGYRVFFSRVTLEDKLGTEYEPYIFAALNSAKLMLAFGTSYQYYNAVWVKNEWSRYLKLMAQDKSKHLIPCYKGIDAYDIPREFAKLQAQDLGKVGATQDLLRGIEKILGGKQEQAAAQPAQTVIVQQSGGTTASAQVERGNMALEDGDWAKADGFFEEALNLDPRCAEAYLGKLLAQQHRSTWAALLSAWKAQYAKADTERLEACPAETAHINKKAAECALAGYLDGQTIRKLYDYDRGYDSALSCRKSQKARQQKELDADRNLARVKQYAQGDISKQISDGLIELNAVLDRRISDAQQEDAAYIAKMKEAYAKHIAKADKEAEALSVKAKDYRETRYKKAVQAVNSAGSISDYEQAIEALKAMNGYKDSNDLVARCEKEIERLEEEKRQEAKQKEAIRQEEAKRKAKKTEIILAIAAAVVVACIAVIIVMAKVVIPNKNYNAAVELMKAGEYDEAIAAFVDMDGYKDSESMISEIYHSVEYMQTLKVGDGFYFGSYGGEKIKWIVLDTTENAIFVISLFGLDAQPYNKDCEDVEWENCTLRTWLNDEFYNTAFSSYEQNMIGTTIITEDEETEDNANSGRALQDKIFLLSMDETEKYFSDDIDRLCMATDYADSNGARMDKGLFTCWWWTRSSGRTDYSAVCVDNNGYMSNSGYNVDFNYICVRPAMWISLAS